MYADRYAGMSFRHFGPLMLVYLYPDHSMLPHFKKTVSDTLMQVPDRWAHSTMFTNMFAMPCLYNDADDLKTFLQYLCFSTASSEEVS
jgi:hypothetical protein